MDFLNQIKKRLKAYSVPLQTAVRETNKRAVALLRANLRSAAKPSKRIQANVTQRNIQAGGMVSTADRQHDVNTRTTTHELSFRRDTFDRRESLDPPTRKITPQQRQLREANVKYQNGLLLEEVKPADNVTAEPIASDNGRNSRARIYDRMSKGALKAHIIDYGTKDQPYQAATINSHRGSNNRWTNILDQKVTWDPKELKGDLTKLAAGTIVRRLAGHPLAQAALVANDAVKVATGKSATEHVGEGYRNTTAAAIQERLKKGQRFTTPYSLPPF